MFIDSWQQECCGQPFGLGDRIEWTVGLIDGRAQGWPDELLVDVRAVVREHPDPGPGIDGSIVVAGDVQAWWDGPQPPGSSIELRGLLREDHHERGYVATPGTIRRIRVITQRRATAGDGASTPAWSGWSATDVTRSPAAFRGPSGAREDPREIGLLVDLEPTPSRDPAALRVRRA